MKERFIHFSDKPIVKLRLELRQSVTIKPNGLWLSVEGNGDGWKSWCEAESFDLDRLKVAHEIVFTDDAKILRLRSATDIDRFHKKFKSEPTGLTGHGIVYIDWSAVASEYQGIIIAPYVWARRLDGDASRWYHGWDCASGSIWDKEAIKLLKPVRKCEAFLAGGV